MTSQSQPQERRKRRLTYGGFALITGVLIAVVFSTVGSANVPDPFGWLSDDAVVVKSDNSGPPSTRPIDDFDAASAMKQIRGSYGVFVRSATAADAAPEHVAGSPLAQNFIDVGLARKIAPRDSKAVFYAIPARGGGELPFEGAGICVLESNGAGSCSSLAMIADGNSIVYADGLDELSKGDVRVRGIVPDGVDYVELISADNQTKSVNVDSNVWVYEGPDKPVDVKWTGNGARVSAAVPGSGSR